MATATQNPGPPPTSIPNGEPQELPPPAQPAKKGKPKKDKLSAEENAKLIQARLSQLEQEKTTEKQTQAEVDREVKKATRDLNDLIKSVRDPMGKIDLLQQKYEDLIADMKKLERDYAKTKKKSDQQQKDSDKAKTEHNKTASMKDRLEKLCRELTKENKKVKDENKRLEDSEKAAKVTVNERLDQMLYDVQDVMNQKGTAPVENLHMELDELFKTRVKVLADQTELREFQFKTILRHKDAEISHLGAKHEVERRRADTEATRARTLTSQVSTFSHTETELRSQLNIYVEKFKQVEDTLNNSNELFLTFRKEMEEMSKKTKRLEKENFTLTRKHEQVNRNIVEMAEERSRDKEDLEKLRKGDVQMRGIIKTMQEQGRGMPDAMQGALDPNGIGDEGEVTESEYDEEYEDDDDEEDEDVEYDEDLDPELMREEMERLHQEQQMEQQKPVFGPVPPPDLGKGKAVVEPLRHQVVNGVAH